MEEVERKTKKTGEACCEMASSEHDRDISPELSTRLPAQDYPSQPPPPWMGRVQKALPLV